MTLKNAIIAAGVAAALALPVAAQAQPVPQYANTEEQIHGTIASIGDKYTVYVRDDRGFVDTVHLHDGTVINPTGLTLASGQSVSILGRTDGRSFDANEIDTPYNVDQGLAYAPDYVAPYPYYDYYPAYALSYPAFISLGFGFGGGYYGHGYYGHGYYGGGYYGHGYGYYGHPYGGGYYGRGYAAGGYHGTSVGGYHGAPTGGFRASGSSAHVSGGFHGGGFHH